MTSTARILILVSGATVLLGLITTPRWLAPRFAPAVSVSRAEPERIARPDLSRADQSVPEAAALPPAPPTQDLLLTGLFGSGSDVCALFMITEPGKPSCNFNLREGEQNEWLHVRAIDLEQGRVTALLKKPVVRIRNIGAEVILSFPTHGTSARRD